MTDTSGDNRATVHDLIRQREQLRGWLARLDEVGSNAPGRVTERVRADYQQRLVRVTEELGTHGEELERSLDGLRAELAEAESRREGALEVLEETRLRHLIGELDNASWDEARPGLENDVAAAEEVVGRTRDEVERLSRLVQEITGENAQAEEAASMAEAPASAAAEEEEPAPAAEPEPEAEPEDLPLAAEPQAELPPFVADEPTLPAGDPFGNEFPPAEPAAPALPDAAADDEDLPWLESLDRQTAEWEQGGAGEDDGLDFLNDIPETRGAAPADEGLAEDDLAFLEELDRAISGTPAAPPAPSPSAATPPPAAPASGGGAIPAGRLICKECGAPNEPHSWYCEVCGSEL